MTMLQLSTPATSERQDSVGYAEQRLREETKAAANAASVAAMLAHVNLAIAYARRIRESRTANKPSLG